MRSGAGAREQQRKNRDADAAEWNQTNLHMLARQPSRDDRADPDSDREQREQQTDARFAQAEFALSVYGNHGQEEGAKKTEPRDADHRVEERRTAPDLGEVNSE